MFDIVSINLTNFRSYIGDHHYTFPTEPGLYLLTGQNQANPRLESNDCGKSTLLEAIFWHGGEAQAARDAVSHFSRDEREALLAFLNSL